MSAAFLQHVAAIEARKGLRERNRTIRELAEVAGENHATVGKKLNGFLWASQSDLLLWAVALERPQIVKGTESIQFLLPKPKNMEDGKAASWVPLTSLNRKPRGRR